MKKALAVLLSMVMALSAFGVAASAFDDILTGCDHPDPEPIYTYDAGDNFAWMNVEGAIDEAFKSYEYYFCYDCELFLVYDGAEFLGHLSEGTLADYGLELVGDLYNAGFLCYHENAYPLPTEDPNDPNISWLDVSNATDDWFKNRTYERCPVCDQFFVEDGGRYREYSRQGLAQLGIVYHEGILSSAILLPTYDDGTLNNGTYWFYKDGFISWQYFINGMPEDDLLVYQDASYYYNPAANAIIITRGDFCETWYYADDSRIFGFLRQVGTECSHLCAEIIPVGFQPCGSNEEFMILDNVTDPAYLNYSYYGCHSCGMILVYDDGGDLVAVMPGDELSDLGVEWGDSYWHWDEDEDGLCDNCGGYRLTEDVSDERYYLVVPDDERTYLRFAEVWACEKDGETVFDMMLEGYRFGYDGDDEEWEAEYAILSGWITAPEADPDQAAAAAVDELIEAIGEVTLESGEAIEAARGAYDALTDGQKDLVNDLDILIAAEETYGDHVAAANVNALIEAIGEVAYTDECKAKIDAARNAYDALTDAQRDIVDDYLALTDAEEEYVALKAAADAAAEAAANRAAADVVTAKIDAIGEVAYTDECKAKIDEARAAYDALTDARKALVENSETLIAAEERYDELKAAAETPDEPTEDENLCKWCGKDHSVNFWQKIVGVFHKILYFFAHLFGRR
ncbi:MAG: hypothetical protein IJL26_13670 [Clostridia bacterium]|nr:hypothetical protein [Clostridia bacterium]